MRFETWVALAALAMMTSGCVTGDLPPASSAPPTTSTAGSSTGGGGAPGGTLVRPYHDENTTDKFFLKGDEDVSGFVPPNNVTFLFVAENQGAQAQVLRDPCGDGNPRIHIEAPNGTTVQIRPPMVRCMAAVYYGPFARGERVYQNLTWNGTIYHGDQASKAPAGRYVAVATFVARRGSTDETVTVRVPVNVLDHWPGQG